MVNDKNKKRILCIVQLPPPVHGAGIMNSHVVNSETIKKSFKLTVINLQFSKTVNKVARFSFLKVIKGFYFSFVIVIQILCKRPDLIYFTLTTTGYALYRDAFYVFIFKVFNIPVVYHLHGKGVKENAYSNNLKRKLYVWIFNNCKVICLSKKLAEDVNGLCNSVPFIVPNGIISVKNRSDLSKKQFSSIPQILFLSNYIRDKGVLVLVEALCILKNQGYKFYARFVGAPSDISLENLENILFAKGLSEYAKAVGPLYGDEKSLEFQRSDIFVFPSFYKNEAFPLVILEAMQHSLPVISTYEGGIPDIIKNNETGILVEVKNAEILAGKIAILLADQDLRMRMGREGFERYIKYFTLSQFESNMVEVFLTILGVNTEIRFRN